MGISTEPSGGSVLHQGTQARAKLERTLELQGRVPLATVGDTQGVRNLFLSEIYFLTVLSATSLKSRCRKGFPSSLLSFLL